MRRIKKARITTISLVPRGANRLPVIYKADAPGGQGLDLDTLVCPIGKFDDTGELAAIVYTPENRDSQGDIASASVIKDAMYEAARRGESIDLRHDDKPIKKDQAYIAERFLVQKGDPRFADMKDYDGKPVDVTGAWATVIKIDDPELRRLYREGKWNGVSMAGTAEVESEKSESETLLQSILSGISGLFTTKKSDNGDIDMTGKELTDTLAANNKSLVDGIVGGMTTVLQKCGVMKPEAKPAGTKEDDTQTDADAAPVFKGDPLKIADVQKHRTALRAYTARKAVDWNDPAAVEKYETDLATAVAKAAEGAEASEEEADASLTDDQRKIKALEADNARLSGRSNQGTGTGEPMAKAAGISKAEVEQAKIGKEMADWINEGRGYKTKTA